MFKQESRRRCPDGYARPRVTPRRPARRDQALHRAASDDVAFLAQLSPNLVGSVRAAVTCRMHALDFRQLARAVARARVCERCARNTSTGHRQDFADGLDPVRRSVLVNEVDHHRSRGRAPPGRKKQKPCGESRWCAEAPLTLARRQPTALAGVPLLLHHPFAQRLRRAPDSACHRHDGRPPRRVLASCSNTSRTARSRTSSENLLFLPMAPSSQELEPRRIFRGASIQ